MVQFRFFILIVISLNIFQWTIAQKKTSSTKSSTISYPSTTSTSMTIDPFVGGKVGNPGAKIRLSEISIDAVHAWAMEMINRALQKAAIDDFTIHVGAGILTIKSPHIVDAKFAAVEKQMVPPNRIRSRLFNGKFEATGVWQFKANADARWFLSRSMVSGNYHAKVPNGELVMINQLRNADGKPTVMSVETKANFSQYQVDIQGAGNLTTIENCDDPVCSKIRAYYEEAVAAVAKTFIKEVINRKLATFPAKIDIQDDLKLDYSLLFNEPKVTDSDIHGGLEGRVCLRGLNGVPFYPTDLKWTDKKRMVTVEMADYTFNTLLFQTHARQYRFSAVDLLGNSPSTANLLHLNCKAQQQPCLGSVFENTTFDQYPSNATGDLVFKTSGPRPMGVAVRSGQSGSLDGGKGVLEIWIPTLGQEQRYVSSKKKLFSRADVRLMRGDFVPKLQANNITGSVKVSVLELAQSMPQGRMVGDQWLNKLASFAQPILTDMFNAFLRSYAQFPLPMLNGFDCASPEFVVYPRSMQIDCDVRSGGTTGQS